MSAAETSHISVLLVDDDQEDYALVRRYLKNARTGTFDVEWASSFEAAFEALAQEKYDLCLLDYQLGKHTGVELLDEMRKKGYDLPAVFLTGRGSLEVDLEAMEMGAFDYLEKADITAALLERSIRYAIENHRVRAALQKTNEELEERVRERTAELRRSNQDLEEFAKVVARDLREPLHAIIKRLDEMRRHDYIHHVEAGHVLAQGFLDPVHRAARNMELLIQSVLDYSRMEEAERPFVEIELARVLQQAQDDLAASIEETGAQIEVGDLPLVTADPDMMRGLFENLLDNALKFRSTETPRIKVWAERKGNAWVCAVQDNGIGISEEDADDIFLMFHQGSHERPHTGVGMGLAMCRKIVQHHGGNIWVDSEPGQGATFYVTLPTEPS